jgi:hypothetical protein
LADHPKCHSWLTNPWLHLTLILLVAGFFRLWQIGAIPPGLFGDEATNGLDALDVLAGRGAVFFPANFGREGLHIWIVAGAFRLLGVIPLALRLPSVIAGILTALATYWLGQELAGRLRTGRLGIGRLGTGRLGTGRLGIGRLGDQKFAQPTNLPIYQPTNLPTYQPTNLPTYQPTNLPTYQPTNLPTYQSILPLLAALYVATSFWHVHFSRFGIRGVFTPLCGALAFAAFWRGVNWADQRKGESQSNGTMSAKGRISESTKLPCHPSAGSGQALVTMSPCHHVTMSPCHAWFALSGFFLGLATHFYTASRFFPFFLGGFLVLQGNIAYASGRREEALLRRHFGGIVLLYAVAALVFVPLGVYFLQHPGSFGQRAGEVAAFGAADLWPRMGQAAAANVLQFFLPGRGDLAQFYNLPGRAVFDPLTAILALIGIAALLWRWRQPAALFLLTWFPALLLPSFLATDRFPTLPRVLGTIPGVYFFPAVGLLAAVSVLRNGRIPIGSLRSSRSLSPCHLVTLSRFFSIAFIAVALLVHAGLTCRDYFRVWGPSAATFDAFEGDMTAAWHWLATHQPTGHVYLSSDIYRHPTFMLLGERATVTTYFQHRDPNLSWFDARAALPLPPSGQPATYLIAASSPPAGRAAEFLAGHGVERDRMLAPDGAPALTVIELPAETETRLLEEAGSLSLAFTDRLTLTGAKWIASSGGRPELWLAWRTTGPAPADWAGYRLEVAVGEWQTAVPFDAFRPPEWVADGRFLSWHRLDLPGGAGEPPRDLSLRLVRADDNRPVAQPHVPDGWHAVAVN